MRVLLLISPDSPALAGLAPILATLIARGATIEAGSAAPRLRAEAISVTEHADAAELEQAAASLTSTDLLIAPGGADASPAAIVAITRALLAAEGGPLIVVDPTAIGDLLSDLGSTRSLDALRSELQRSAALAVAAHVAPLVRDSASAMPARDVIVLERIRTFGHGENQHQAAAAYRRVLATDAGILGARVLQGQEPSLNDLLDLDAGAQLVADLPTPSVALIRHTDPIGVATAETALGALTRAIETDAAASSGSTIVLNVPIDRAVAIVVAAGSFESVLAPALADDGAAEALRTRPDLTVVIDSSRRTTEFDMISVSGAVLLQTADTGNIDRSQLRVVTERRPTLDELTDLLFSWRVVRHIRSNAIVVARGAATLGIGAAQVNRRVAVDIALNQAGERARGAVMASDAYFPFAEGIAAAAAAGITAIVQPGGSRRDAAAIEIADRHGITMVFTGRRHYRR
ncbi:bifunctional phosphoribosylaminoimidazolecarboxamide formyltransferase/inosine monophosphate cyclohydrolase [bacterium]|nr:bifunctional phosphoribosylaminoimidazolecarboxamide formyltransferase/inosine monophosphate cyclohydrolase [bacterium]